MHKAITIAIADDSEILRYALMCKLAEQPGYNVVAEAVNGDDLVRKIEALHTNLPDVCILDIGMPVMNGYDAIKILQQKWPAIRILVFSVHHHEYAIKKMLLSGARGFIVKETAPSVLADAVKAITEEGYYYTQQVSEKMFTDARNGLMSLMDFTKIESLLLPSYCKSAQCSDIATEFSLNIRTIEKHQQHVYLKSGINTREELMLFAMKNELI